MATSNSRALKVMVDANVLIAATGWPRWPYEVVRHAIKGDFRLVLCGQIIEEAKRRVAVALPGREERLEHLLLASRYQSIPDPTAQEVIAARQLLRDQTDVSIALAAINAQVDCFVTSDKDFTDPSNVELHLRLKIVLPAVFLRDFMGWPSDALEAIRYQDW